MKMKSLLLLTFIFLLVNIKATNKDKIVGVWYTHEKRSKIKIIKNEDDSYSGTIIWLKKPMEDGKPKLDKNNPNETLKTRELIGLAILNNFKFDDSDEEWVDGTIYDPDSGNTYKCYMWFNGNSNSLNVKGYIGVSLIGRKTTWTRVE
ncbi:DUF2147 domain-containing protein [Plebeiibacterium marinum]|uniref:DUF2147 domain-containing protein n=1 Tax=Plebeiibacterium marinum TaxID=2992111 RepID=A0AAE3MCS7_9BACT|nr:DUF2147 domain-containing protein [Plebeiobacterium marinum]MCW3805230.1 DUF2147 domain-containing protein [Plebeiobacterium marinum]